MATSRSQRFYRQQRTAATDSTPLSRLGRRTWDSSDITPTNGPGDLLGNRRCRRYPIVDPLHPELDLMVSDDEAEEPNDPMSQAQTPMNRSTVDKSIFKE